MWWDLFFAVMGCSLAWFFIDLSIFWKCGRGVDTKMNAAMGIMMHINAVVFLCVFIVLSAQIIWGGE